MKLEREEVSQDENISYGNAHKSQMYVVVCHGAVKYVNWLSCFYTSRHLWGWVGNTKVSLNSTLPNPFHPNCLGE